MKKLFWTGPHAAMKAGETYISEFTEIEAVGLRREIAPEQAGDNPDEGVWVLEAYAERAPDLKALNAAIREMDPAWKEASKCVVETLPEKDWVAHSLEGLGVVEAGRFTLYGVHDADKVTDDDGVIPIRIDANQAFGTGHHPTTAGCLTLLDRFAGAPADKILDLGCGSGVLAIAGCETLGP